MLKVEHAGHPWVVRVRCELPCRPLGPGGEEEPVRATFISVNDTPEDAARYATFVKAMASIDVYKCVHMKSEKPSARALGHLEQSDIVCIGDEPVVLKAWHSIAEGMHGVLERVKWRYYSGAVLMGIGNGAMLLGKRWWAGDPAKEVAYKHAVQAGEEPEPIDKSEQCFISAKAAEVCPAAFCVDDEEARHIAELYGNMSVIITLPSQGAAIFNIDGTIEPSNALLMEHQVRTRRPSDASGQGSGRHERAARAGKRESWRERARERRAGERARANERVR